MRPIKNLKGPARVETDPGPLTKKQQKAFEKKQLRKLKKAKRRKRRAVPENRLKIIFTPFRHWNGPERPYKSIPIYKKPLNVVIVETTIPWKFGVESKGSSSEEGQDGNTGGPNP